MSENTASQEPNKGPEGNKQGSEGHEKYFSQSELDRIIGERLARERQQYADYEEVKKKASKLDEIEEANRSEIEKAQAKAQEAEARAQRAEDDLNKERLNSLRHRIAIEKGVPESRVKYVTGETQEEIEAAATDLAGAVPERREGLVPSAGQGGSTPDPAGDAAERAKAWLGRK